MVSIEMMEKLEFKIEKHPYHYKWSWLKKRRHIKVGKYCLVSFSIEDNYKDLRQLNLIFKLIFHPNPTLTAI